MSWRTPEFIDRRDAGRQLGAALAAQELAPPVLVLALPRGGVAVAAEVAARLSAPLDLLLVRKIPSPVDPEVALGAVAEADPPVVVLNPDVTAMTRPSEDYLEQTLEEQVAEIARRRRVYLGNATQPDVRNGTVILVDDGLATGATARAAAWALRRRGVANLILAVPVAPSSTLKALAGEFDQVVCLRAPDLFVGVGGCYREFHQLSDQEVVDLIAAARPE